MVVLFSTIVFTSICNSYYGLYQYGNTKNASNYIGISQSPTQSSQNATHLSQSPALLNQPSSHLNLCAIEEITVGSWVTVTYDKPPYIPLAKQRRCPGLTQDEPYSMWRWEPEAAKLKRCEFSVGNTFHNFASSYCDLMKNKTVAIIGDSISVHHYLSLTHLLGVPKPLLGFRKFQNQISHVCENTSILIGGKDYYLNDRVAEIIDSYSPDVLVLNRGSHYVPDSQLLKDFRTNIFPPLEDWQAKCNLNKSQKGGDDCLLIWRTTVPGHPDCMAYQEPMQSVEKMEEIIALNGTKYHWHEFSHQSELVLNAFQQQTNLTYEVMDTYSINILRPDLHLKMPNFIDCLHTCMPDDSTDSWLFHHMLQLKYGNHTNAANI
eukprot:CAMPEP_0196823882 /NCGR_PEP_ID=MMETSP1362-20130617/89470_1 /TAXON_ID=163516 /ORGANISM="Leptocylindrus danicus, Strain CCMP1856" /LENGTH=376 /DNA_ID=CAMNT_0042203929 /DNA_START=77 /DNA_END=1207 /DNA_ORIENTATION=-